MTELHSVPKLVHAEVGKRNTMTGIFGIVAPYLVWVLQVDSSKHVNDTLACAPATSVNVGNPDEIILTELRKKLFPPTP